MESRFQLRSRTKLLVNGSRKIAYTRPKNGKNSSRERYDSEGSEEGLMKISTTMGVCGHSAEWRSFRTTNTDFYHPLCDHEPNEVIWPKQKEAKYSLTYISY